MIAPERLVVGLGNPGVEYRATRHNLGFLAVERLARDLGVADAGRAAREECRALVVEAGDSLIVQPLTFMNRSGASVRCLAERYELPPERLLVIYDEIQLPLGRIRLRAAGGPGGHRGMESIIEALGTESVPRMRLGIGPMPPGMGEEGLPEFVLAPFLPEEQTEAASLVTRAAEAARIWIEAGIDAAMNRANQPELRQDEPRA